MARKAFVSSDMAHDEKLFDLAESHPDAVMMWPWIVTWFDDWGRALASPKRIKSQLFPNLPTVTVDTVESALIAFDEVGLIELYEVDEHRYMAIPMDKWFSWQTHIRSEKRENDRSKYPPCPTDCAQVREGARDDAQFTQKCDLTPTPSLTPTKDLSGGGERAHAREIAGAYEREYGRIPNLTQINDLVAWVDRGMEATLVIQAIHKSRLLAKDLDYAIGILNKQFERGIRTVAQAEIDDAQWQAAASGGGRANGTRGKPGPKHRRESKGEAYSITGTAHVVGRVPPLDG